MSLTIWPKEERAAGVSEQYDVWFGGTKLLWDTYGALPPAIGLIIGTLIVAGTFQA